MNRIITGIESCKLGNEGVAGRLAAITGPVTFVIGMVGCAAAAVMLMEGHEVPGDLVYTLKTCLPVAIAHLLVYSIAGGNAGE